MRTVVNTRLHNTDDSTVDFHDSIKAIRTAQKKEKEKEKRKKKKEIGEKTKRMVRRKTQQACSERALNQKNNLSITNTTIREILYPVNFGVKTSGVQPLKNHPNFPGA